MKNTREQELMQDGVAINEWQEMKVYDEKESKKAVKIAHKKEKNAFFAGDILLFSANDASLCLPNLKDEKGQTVFYTDEYGNKFPEKDEEKMPFIKWSKYHNGKKAVCNMPIPLLIDLMEDLAIKINKGKAKKIYDILDTVFPYEKIDYGAFTENGERKLNEKNFTYFVKSNIALRSFPIIENNEYKQTVFCWVDKYGEHSITILFYASEPIDGAMLGIK